MVMRCVTTSPESQPSLRMSTRSLAWMLPRTLPITTISRALRLAVTTPPFPTVTRLPSPTRLMEPSTCPSMKSDSVAAISPLIISPLPMLTYSCGAACVEPVGARIGFDGAVDAAVLMIGSSVGDSGIPFYSFWHVGSARSRQLVGKFVCLTVPTIPFRDGFNHQQKPLEKFGGTAARAQGFRAVAPA